jgi:hypothetical protein
MSPATIPVPHDLDAGLRRAGSVENVLRRPHIILEL